MYIVCTCFYFMFNSLYLHSLVWLANCIFYQIFRTIFSSSKRIFLTRGLFNNILDVVCVCSQYARARVLILLLCVIVCIYARLCYFIKKKIFYVLLDSLDLFMVLFAQFSLWSHGYVYASTVRDIYFGHSISVVETSQF